MQYCSENRSFLSSRSSWQSWHLNSTSYCNPDWSYCTDWFCSKLSIVLAHVWIMERSASFNTIVVPAQWPPTQIVNPLRCKAPVGFRRFNPLWLHTVKWTLGSNQASNALVSADRTWEVAATSETVEVCSSLCATFVGTGCNDMRSLG